PARLRKVLTLIALLSVIGFAGSQIKRASAKATFTVLAGTDTPYGITVLAFAPQTIKVHRGDTITWQFLSYHNVRFAAKPADLVVIGDIDGKQMPEIN